MWMERSKVNITIKTQKESSWKRWFFFATVSAPYLYDAAGAKCYDVEVMLKHTGEDNYTVSYVPSDEWLSAPARVYPVVLDPTIQTADSTQVEDNHVADGSLKDTQYPYYLSYMYAGKKD